MDKEIPVSERRQQMRKTSYRVLVGAIITSICLFAIWSLVGDKLSLNNKLIATVDRGSIEIAVNAAGKLNPLLEEIVVSPISTRILEVYKNPGDTVVVGEPLLKLDLGSVETEYQQQLDEKEKLISQMTQVRIRLENTLSESKMQCRLAEMRLKQLSVDLEGETHLQRIGASSADKVRKATLDYEEAKLKLEQLEQKIVNEEKGADAELRVQQLNLEIAEKALAEKARLLQNARILSPKTAILTFIQNQIGTSVLQGDQLAIVSDLTQYKVECEISDKNRDKLSIGSRANIKIGQEQFSGTIYSITPSITNGLIKFTILLNDSSNPNFRGGLNVDVNVFYGRRAGVLRIPHGGYYHGSGDYYLWVLQDKKAVKQKVKLGDGDFEYVEVISGLSLDDTLILSDMERYDNKSELQIK